MTPQHYYFLKHKNVIIEWLRNIIIFFYLKMLSL
jgi:hypothetical protein